MPEKRGEAAQGAEKPNIGSKKLLGDLTLKKIAYYLSKTTITDSEIYSVVKEFFSELLEIKNEFTFSELSVEIEKTYFEQPVKDKITEFIDKLRLIEYTSDKYTEEDLKKMFNEFESLVPFILKTRSGPETGFMTMIKSILHHKEKTETEIHIEEKELNNNEILDRLESFTTEESKSSDDSNEEPPSPIPQSSKKEKIDDAKAIELAINSINAEEILPETTDHTDWAGTETKSDITESTSDDWAEDVKKPKKEEPSKSKKTKKKSLSKKRTKKSNVDITELIKKAKRVRKKERLKKQYTEINHVYENLSNDDKHKYFEDVHKLYEKLKSLK